MNALIPIDTTTISGVANGTTGVALGASITAAITKNAVVISLSIAVFTALMGLCFNIANTRINRRNEQINIRRMELLEEQIRKEKE